MGANAQKGGRAQKRAARGGKAGRIKQERRSRRRPPSHPRKLVAKSWLPMSAGLGLPLLPPVVPAAGGGAALPLAAGGSGPEPNFCSTLCDAGSDGSACAGGGGASPPALPLGCGQGRGVCSKTTDS